MSRTNNPYEPKGFKITEKSMLTSDTALFKVSSGINPDPGQFVEVSVMGIGECPISVCSYAKGHVELLVRAVGNVTKKIIKLEKGGTILMRGPYGTGYPMKEMEGKDIVLIAGGTGLAPPRSVLEYVEKNHKKFGSVSLFLGFRDPAEMLFKEDIDRWTQKYNVTLTVDHCADPSYKGKVCFVTDAFAGADITPENKAVILCGPPVMMNVCIEKLKSKGFEDEQIYLSFERHMKCGVGKCGHCMVAGKYMCRDGPVFSYKEARDFYD